MQNGYYQATGGMVTQFNKVDVITNNLANINTAGFKRDDVVIADFKRVFREVQDELPLANHTRAASRFANTTIDGVPQISQNYTDFSTGALKASTNPLDLALTREDAFYLVQTKDGEIRLSKDGDFQLDEQGYLVNKQGYKILNSSYFQNPANALIRINPGAGQVIVDKDGNVEADGAPLGRLFIAQVDDLRALEKDGDNMFRIDDLTRVRELVNSGAVAQGFSQASNVNAVSEMVALIEANRMVEMYQRVMSSHMDELNQDAITKLATT